MKELLPVVFGIAGGCGLAALRPAGLRAWMFPLAIVVAGLSASAVNGELVDGLWPVFVSFDIVLAGLGVVAGLMTTRLLMARSAHGLNGARRLNRQGRQ
jgi:hypothetical protein